MNWFGNDRLRVETISVPGKRLINTVVVDDPLQYKADGKLQNKTNCSQGGYGLFISQTSCASYRKKERQRMDRKHYSTLASAFFRVTATVLTSVEVPFIAQLACGNGST